MCLVVLVLCKTTVLCALNLMIKLSDVCFLVIPPGPKGIGVTIRLPDAFIILWMLRSWKIFSFFAGPPPSLEPPTPVTTTYLEPLPRPVPIFESSPPSDDLLPPVVMSSPARHYSRRPRAPSPLPESSPVSGNASPVPPLRHSIRVSSLMNRYG